MGKYMLVVGMKVDDPANEAEFNDWYNTIHFPDVLETPNFERATRWENTEPRLADAKYLALYEIETDDIQAGQLELKTREGRLGKKFVEPVQLELPLEKLRWKDILKSLAERTIELKSLVLLTRPVIINRYLRSYFVSADHKIRITLDRNLTSYDQSLSQQPNLSRSNPRIEELIIEIKADSNQTQRLANVIAEFPFYAGQYSKYLIATNYSV